jgi:iron complex transport system substrate-binding protein
MRQLALAIAAIAAFALPANAQETRTVVDDTGTEVTIPVEPKRIVALHDSSLTIPLLELGVIPVGSHGRGETEETAFIRSSAAITGIDFNNSDIVWVGNYPADLERIAAVEPDLILTTQWQPLDPEQLRLIAPTVVFDYTKRTDWEIYDWIADLTGTTDQLDRMKRRYDAQIELIRKVIDTESILVSTVHANPGELFAYNPYGNIGRVLRDAGFQRPEIIEAIPEGDNRSFTAESLQAFDGDFILTTYRSSAQDYPDAVRGYFDSVLPGWCDALHACREGQMIMLSRAEASSSSYYALGAVAYAILTVIGGRDFVPMPR